MQADPGQFRSTLFHIQPGEAPAVGLNLLQSVFIGLPRLFTLTVGGAFFLDRYSADNLPLVYIAAAVVIPLVGFVQLYFERRVSFVRLQLGTLLVMAAIAGGFLLLLKSSDARWPALALFIWCGAEFHLSNIVLWSTASRVFTVREGKRLFGLIGSGEIIAAIVGGALTPLLVRHLGTAELLSLSLIGFLLAFLNLVSMARLCRQRLARTPEERSSDRGRRRQSFSALLRSRYLVLIFLTYALILSAGFFVNNIFYFQLGDTFSTAAELAAFLGRFFAVFAFLSLLFRTFLSGRVLLRFGLLGGLLSTPLVVLAGSLCVVCYGWAGAGAALLFWSIVAMRLLERLFMGAFGQPAYYTLYQPLSRERRARVQTLAETISGPIVGGLAGVILLVLTKSLGFRSVGLAAALLPVLVVWIAISVAASRGFRDALTSALKRRGISGSDLTVNDPTSLRILERGLDSPRPVEVLYCLRLLEEAGHPRFRELLQGLMEHAKPEVRRGVYQVVERIADSSWLPLLEARLEHEQDSETQGAVLRAAGAAAGPAALAVIEPRLDAPDNAIRGGALVAMIRYCGANAGRQAGDELDRLVRSEEPSERIFSAHLLGELADRAHAEALASLLKDDDLGVRRAALASVGSMDDPEIWRRVIANLEVAAVRTEALRALLQSEETAFPVLEEEFHSPTSSHRLRRLVLQIFGRAGTIRATQFLLGQLLEDNRGLLSESLWSLHLCAYQASAGERELVEASLRREIGHAGQVIAAGRDLANAPGVELLMSALNQELERARKRIFLLLSFLYDSETMMKIWSNFGGSAALRDLALELFETRVAKDHWAITAPILTGTSDERSLPAREREYRMLFQPTFWASSWTRACAVDAVVSLKDGLSAEDWVALLDDADQLVGETARSSWSRVEGSDPSATRSEQLPTVERVRVLRGVSIFREIDDELLSELAQSLEEVRVQPGESVFREGDLGGSMFIVSAGCLRLHSRGETISEFRAGDTFGELSALEAEARTESASAVEPSHLFVLSDTDLHAFMATRIEVVRGIIAVLCHRVRVAPTDKLANQEEKERREAAATAIPVSLYSDDVLSSLQKVLILKTADIFAGVEDEILAEVAARTQEVRLRRNEVLFHKGDPGTTTYIVAAGRLRIHIGEQWIADAAERTVIGELAALSSEPRTASVTAAEDSLLLALDQGSLFDLMWDQHEIVRGIIGVLVGRLRRLRRAARSSAVPSPDQGREPSVDA